MEATNIAASIDSQNDDSKDEDSNALQLIRMAIILGGLTYQASEAIDEPKQLLRINPTKEGVYIIDTKIPGILSDIPAVVTIRLQKRNMDIKVKESGYIWNIYEDAQVMYVTFGVSVDRKYLW